MTVLTEFGLIQTINERFTGLSFGNSRNVLGRLTKIADLLFMDRYLDISRLKPHYESRFYGEKHSNGEGVKNHRIIRDVQKRIETF